MKKPRAQKLLAKKSKSWRRLRFTKQGKYFVGLTLGIGFGAINTGNNLLYLILSVLLVFIVGSGILSEIIFRVLKPTRKVPKRIFAKKPFLMGLNLFNPRKKLPSFSVEVEDVLAGNPIGKKCFFLKVPACFTQNSSYRYEFEKRGAYRFTGFRLGTKFPFSFFHKYRFENNEEEMIVYPAIYPVTAKGFEELDHGEHVFAGLGRYGEFFSIREYKETDDPKDIHWRKSARLNKLLIRQYHVPEGRCITIRLDNRQTGEVISADEIDQQEKAVSRAASYAVYFIERGFSVGLITRTVFVKQAKGQSHLDSLLKTLALIEFIREDKPFITVNAHGLTLAHGHEDQHARSSTNSFQSMTT